MVQSYFLVPWLGTTPKAYTHRTCPWATVTSRASLATLWTPRLPSKAAAPTPTTIGSPVACWQWARCATGPTPLAHGRLSPGYGNGPPFPWLPLMIHCLFPAHSVMIQHLFTAYNFAIECLWHRCYLSSFLSACLWSRWRVYCRAQFTHGLPPWTWLYPLPYRHQPLSAQLLDEWPLDVSQICVW